MELQTFEEPDWFVRAQRANAPFNTDNCPVLRLWCGLKSLPQVMNGLRVEAQQIQNRMILVDDAPRHDGILSDEVLGKVAHSSYAYPMWQAHNRLKHSLSVIDEAFGNIANVFRGDLKATHYERLARHRAEAQNLLELFSKLPAPDAVQPFTIRQQSMAGLYLRFGEVLEQITPLRRSVKDDVLPGDFFTELSEAEAELFRLRSSVARWRDNPSQKLGAKMSDCYTRIAKIDAVIERMKQNAQFECQQLGMIFSNRAGISQVERC